MAYTFAAIITLSVPHYDLVEAGLFIGDGTIGLCGGLWVAHELGTSGC